ncbi:MAG: hypothetical protein HZA54_06855 [Planctomycetes bacterium]|nr:hypothetical protein [Planctomycetota bacterium]
MKLDDLLEKSGPVLHVALTFGLYAGCALVLGCAAWPGVALAYGAWHGAAALPLALRLLVFSVAGATAYFVYGVSLMALVVLLRFLFRLRLEPGRYPFYSLAALRWATFNTLILLVRFTFMDFVRVTPLLPLFFRLLGAKVGRRVHINTKIVADACLLEIGDGAVVGGDVTLICHSAEGGQLIVEPVKIGERAELGILAVILPGVEIGARAVVGAHALVPKRTIIPPDTVWAGVPARQVGVRDAAGGWSAAPPMPPAPARSPSPAAAGPAPSAPAPSPSPAAAGAGRGEGMFAPPMAPAPAPSPSPAPAPSSASTPACP